MSDPSNKRPWLLAGGVVLVGLAGLALWALSDGGPGRESGSPGAGGGELPEVLVRRDGSVVADGSTDGIAGDSRGGAGDRDDPGQAETFDGRTDGAVPLDEGTTPPHAPPDDVVRLTPEQLDERRLQQVGRIEERIEALDEEIAASPADSSLRGILETRREHLEQRRAQLLSAVVDEHTADD